MPRPQAAKSGALHRGARVDKTSDAVRRTTLPGGLRVVTEYIPSVHSASVGVWVNVGSRDEPATLRAETTTSTESMRSDSPTRLASLL